MCLFYVTWKLFLLLGVHVDLDVQLEAVRATWVGVVPAWAAHGAQGAGGPCSRCPRKVPRVEIVCLALSSLYLKINDLNFSEITSQMGFL